ncbi:MBL fold metallo-hydrolase [Patescibacteria group bacterium]|nr:MBL fold metallo-hydrolase [Patescibacteria group bacterium]MBU1075315.1 MBL fold metallo-hydrolase [Patescibacteria group bacterium]MBU1951545.1 MBL fold metallo-hydrolase [Patescibacteria group bacterium]MBU2236351.1 MBL fold metallo-hydrolase [Patescibacteria group bacterium]
MKIINHLIWLGHAAFQISLSNIIYIDPYELEDDLPKADYIFITHEHFDHCSPEDINKIIKDSTQIVATKQCERKIDGNVKYIEVGDRFYMDKMKVEVVTAYNIDKFREPGLPYHPKEEGKVGYILNLNGERIYHAGDTDFIPEMHEIKNIDIALLPVSGKYTMTAEEAVKATDAIKPKIAIPMHYGGIVGTVDDAKKFQKLSSIRVLILSK